MNSLYSIMAIAAILSLSFCKDDKDDPMDNGDAPGIKYAKGDSQLPDTIELTEGDENVEEYTIVLNTQPSGNVMVDISLPANTPDNLQLNSGSQTVNGADTSITLTFATDTWNTPQTVKLTLEADDIASGNASVTITHSSTSDDSDYDSLSRDVMVSIQDDDMPSITYAQQDKSELPDTITLMEEDINSNMVEYTIVLNTQPTANVEIEITLPSNSPSNLSIASGSQDENGAGSSITLTYTTDTWDTPQTVTLTFTDNDISSSINGSLTHIVTSGDPNYNNKDTLNRTITLQLRDAEAGVLYQKDNASLPETIELTEGTDSEYSYMIVLANQPTHDVTIGITLNNSPDNLRIDEGGNPVTFTSITFANSSGGVNGWDIPQTINLTFADNDFFFGTIMSTLTHITSSTDDEYMGIPNKNLMISLIDDEIDTTCTQPGVVSEDDFTPDISGEDYGDGTENNPYIICNADQLEFIGTGTPKIDFLGSNVYYELGKDIDASSITAAYDCEGTCTGFQPIGDCGVDDICNNADDMSFTGTLDGKGFTVSDLRININVTSGRSYAGLFGYTFGANIRNIGLLNVDIDASSTSNRSFAGGLVGNSSSSSITNSYSTGNVSSSSSFRSFAGGLVGNTSNTSSSITNSYSTVNASSFSSSSVDNDASYAGGLVGNNSGNSITNSYSTGNVSSASSSAADSFAGGLVGQHIFSGSITNSYSTGNVFSSSSSAAANSFVGGLVGSNFVSSITNSWSTGNVSSSSSFVGGLVGQNSGSITNSYHDEITSGQTDITGNSSGTLICIGGFVTDPFKQNVSGTGTCNNASPTIFFNWHEDMNSNRYDSNGDGMIDSSDGFVWNFGTTSEYPFIASTPGTPDEQAVRMASGFLRFSNTALGTPSASDFVFFYDIDDPAMNIDTSGTGVQGTTANNYQIQDADGNALASPSVTNAGVISGINSGPAEFYLKVTFIRGASPMASYSHRYRFKK